MLCAVPCAHLAPYRITTDVTPVLITVATTVKLTVVQTLVHALTHTQVSELDVDDPDMEARANGYEMIMRALFASPVIEGIMFWGFWQLAQWRVSHLLD
jgi:phosphoribosylformylglycinamidine (FGAM) synthase PurS component